MAESRLEGADFTNLSSEILRGGNSIRFKAYGSSMLPWINDGDLLTIQPIEKNKIKVGQVVFYSSTNKKPVVHRVIRILLNGSQGKMLIRGDASPSSEELIASEQILGKVVRIHRGSKAIQLDHNLWWRLAKLWPRFLKLTYLMLRIQRRLRRYIILSPKENNH